jgi:hypothetical protein
MIAVTDRARVNRWLLACAIAATSAIGLGNLAGWLPAMVRSLRAGAMDGVVGGGDFAMFWTAGRLASQGDWDTLYSLDGLAGVMDAPVGAVSFAYPPPFAMGLQALSRVDYATAFGIWLTISAASLLVVVLLSRVWGMVAILAMLFSVYVALRFGQVVPIAVLFAMMSGWALDKDRPFVAGLALGLLSLKPQFLIGPVLVLIATPWLRRSTLLGAAACAGSIIGVSAVVAPEAWSAYLSGLRDVTNPGVSTRWDFSILSLTSDLPWTVAAPLTLGLMLFVIWLALRASSRTDDARQKLAIGLVLSLLVSPRVVNYDWTLLIPAIAWLSPSIRFDSPLAVAGGFVAVASLSGFVGLSWLSWVALATFIGLHSVRNTDMIERGTVSR